MGENADRLKTFENDLRTINPSRVEDGKNQINRFSGRRSKCLRKTWRASFVCFKIVTWKKETSDRAHAGFSFYPKNTSRVAGFLSISVTGCAIYPFPIGGESRRSLSGGKE